jgi:hypothetical protein
MSFFEKMKKQAAETAKVDEPKKDEVKKPDVKPEIKAEEPKVEAGVETKVDAVKEVAPKAEKETSVKVEAAPITQKSISKIDDSTGKNFAVGIDLGTTHCVLSYADITDVETEFSQQVMGISQLTSPSIVEEKLQLPSFIYQANDAELPENSIVLPWNPKPDLIVGEIARSLGSKTPIRLVSSAKSWLCHAGVDCKSPI